MSEPPRLEQSDRDELVAFLDGELKGEEARRIERKLNLDPTARAEADAYKRTWDLLDFLPRPQASSSFTERTLTKVSAIRKPVDKSRWREVGSFWRWPTWVASLGMAGFIGFSSHRLLPVNPSENELVRDLRLIENKRYYESVDSDMSFLQQLADADLFGDDTP